MASAGIDDAQLDSILGKVEGKPDAYKRAYERRREQRNKRSKVRTKFVMESLREEMIELQDENARLRAIVKEKMPEVADEIFASLISSPYSDEEGPNAAGGGGNNEDDCLAKLTHDLAIDDDYGGGDMDDGNSK